jgi:small subunit ribosomal protein S2
MKFNVSLEKLIQTGAHFGHQVKRWNPKMKPYIYEEKDGIHIFDLIKTKQLLEEALEFLYQSSREGKRVLFVGTKKQAKEKIGEVAQKSGSFYVKERWLGGTLTNFDQIHNSWRKLVDMKKKKEEGEYKGRTKKELLLIDRDIERMERFFGGLVGMEQKPDILVVVDVKRERTAVKEAQYTQVKLIALVDTNGDPTNINYPITMNDDATKAIDYVLDLMAESIVKGQAAIKDKKPTQKVN